MRTRERASDVGRRRSSAAAAVLTATVLLARAPARAEEPVLGPVRLTLAEALARAAADSPRLAQLRSLESAAGAGLDGARAQRIPSIDLSASYTRNSNVPEFSVPSPAGSQVVFPNIPDNWRSRVGLTAPLYAGRRIESGIEAARGERDATAKDLEAGEHDLVLETSTAYWLLVATRESESVYREAVVSYESHLVDATNREKLGMAARNEVLTVQVERDRAELGRLEAANAAEVAQANLVRLLGLAPGSRVEPVEPLEAPPSAPEDTEALVRDALSSRPERASLEARLAAATFRVDVQKAAARPQVSATAAYEVSNPNARYLPPVAAWHDTWSVGAGLTFSLYDGGRAAAAAAQAAAQADAIRRQIEELDRRIRLDVTARVLDVATARAAVAVATRNVEAAEENRRVSAERYRAGVGLSTELRDAEIQLLRAGLDRTETLTRLRTAMASLDRAVGR